MGENAGVQPSLRDGPHGFGCQPWVKTHGYFHSVAPRRRPHSVHGAAPLSSKGVLWPGTCQELTRNTTLALAPDLTLALALRVLIKSRIRIKSKKSAAASGTGSLFPPVHGEETGRRLGGDIKMRTPARTSHFLNFRISHLRHKIRRLL